MEERNCNEIEQGWRIWAGDSAAALNGTRIDASLLVKHEAANNLPTATTDAAAGRRLQRPGQHPHPMAPTLGEGREGGGWRMAEPRLGGAAGARQIEEERRRR